MTGSSVINPPSINTDPISLKLMSNRLEERANFHQILHMKHNGAEGILCQVSFTSLYRVKFRESNSLSIEELSKMWRIGLKTAKNTILVMTHKYICSTDMLARRLITDKSQLRYKQLSRHYGMI